MTGRQTNAIRATEHVVKSEDTPAVALEAKVGDSERDGIVQPGIPD